MKKTLLLAFLCLTFAVSGADDYTTLIAAAKMAERDKKPARAIESYRKAASCTRKPAERYYAIQKAARLLNRAKKKNESKKLFLAFAEDPANPKLNRTIAYLDCTRVTDDRAEKLRFLDAGIALKAGDWPEAACHNEKGAIRFTQKQYAQAAAEYRTVAENAAYPAVSRTNAYLGLASVAVQQKDYAEAHRCYRCIREFGKTNPRFVSVDGMKAEAKLYYREGKYDEGNAIHLAIAKNTKFSRRDREKAFAELIETEYNRRNDPIAAKKMLKETASLKLKPSFRVQTAERDIKYLLDEED